MKIRKVISSALVFIMGLAFILIITVININTSSIKELEIGSTSCYKSALSEINSSNLSNTSNWISIEEFYDCDSFGIFTALKSSTPTVLEDAVITISDGKQLDAFNKICNSNSIYNTYKYALINDIDYTEATRYNCYFEPIGKEDTPFSGEFNGNGFEINSLKLKTYTTSDIISSVTYSSMFAYNTGKVCNLGLINTSIQQTIKPENVLGVAPLVGKNSGIITNAYVVDRRNAQTSEGGIGASGGYSISGFVYDNQGSISNCYVSYSILVSYTVQDYFDFFEIAHECSDDAIFDNVYFQDDCIKSVENGVYIYDEYLVGINLDSHELNIYGEYVDSIDSLNQKFNSLDGWYTSLSYPSNRPEIQYPTRKGLKMYESDENTLLIENELDFVNMFKWMNMNPYYASKSMTYILTNDIDLKNVPAKFYQYDDFFNSKFTGKTITGSLTLKDGSSVQTPTIYNASIQNTISYDGFECYGVFPLLSGEISNVNFYNENNISDFSEGSKNLTKSIGVVSGFVEDGTIENVNIYANISLDTSSNQFGRYIAGMAVGIAGRLSHLIHITTNGMIDGGIHDYDASYFSSQASGYGDGNSLGGVIGYQVQTSKQAINLLSAVSLSLTSYSTNALVYQTAGGIIGSGYLTKFNQIENKGDITSGSNTSSNTGLVYCAGIMGRIYGVSDSIYSIHNQGNISAYISSSKAEYYSGIANVDLIIDASATTLLKSLSTTFVASGITNSSNISISNQISTTDSPLVSVAGMMYLNSTNGFTSKLEGIYNLNYKYNDDHSISNSVLTSTVDISSVSKYAPVIMSSATSNTGIIYAKSCYNLKDISFTTSQIGYIASAKYSGCILGNYITLEDCRNEGNLNVTIDKSMPNLASLDVYGVFESVSDGNYANVIYNGGDITLSLANISYNVNVAGICFENASSFKSDDDYEVYNPISNEYDKSLAGSLDNVINKGNITQCNEEVVVSASSNVNIAGIAIVNSGVISSAFNLGNIKNSVSFTANKYTNASGIAVYSEGAYAQIKDCANNGEIRNINMSTQGYVCTSGIVARNDLLRNNNYPNSNNKQHKQLILYTINYGQIIGYSKKSNVTITSSSYNIPTSCTAGILASGVLGMINTVNYANIYGSEVTSGMIGNANFSKYASNVSENSPVIISNSINYGNVKALYRTRTVSGVPTAVTYKEILAFDPKTDTIISKIPLQTDGEYAGSVIAVFNYGNSENAKNVNIRYLLSFLSTISLVGIECNIPSGVIGATDTMFTAKPNDRYLNSMIVYSPLTSTKDTNNNIGVFSKDFAFRKAIEGRLELDLENYPTDKFLTDYFQFVAFSKINDNILDSIGWSTIAYLNAAEMFSTDLTAITNLLHEYNTISDNNYSDIVNDALNTSSWVSNCDSSTLASLLTDIIETKDLEGLKVIVKELCLSNTSKDLVTTELRETVINTIINEIKDVALTKAELISILESVMYSDLLADIIGQSDESLASVKETIEEYIALMDVENLHDLALSYISILGDSNSTIYDNIFTDSRFAKDRYELLVDLLGTMDNAVYKDILSVISNSASSSSVLMREAINSLTEEQVSALYMDMITGTSDNSDVIEALISLLKQSDANTYFQETSPNITEVADDFESQIDNADEKVSLWNSVKNNLEIKQYLESNLNTVYDVYNTAHKGIYAKATEFRNSYQSNDGPSANTFVVNENGTSTTTNGDKFRATEYDGVIQTRYIYTPDEYVSNAYTNGSMTYANTYFYGPYVNESNTLWNSSGTGNLAGGAKNQYMNLFDNTTTVTTQRYVPVYIDLDEQHLANLIAGTSNTKIYKFMWNDVGSSDAINQWVSEDIIATVPGNNIYVLKKNTVDDSSAYLIVNGYNYSTASTTTHNSELSSGLIYAGVANNNQAWNKSDVLFASVSSSIITGIYYQQDQWDKNGAFLTAKNKGSSYGVITTQYIDYSLDDLINLDGIRTKGLSNGVSDDDEISIIVSLLDNYLLNSDTGKRLIISALTKLMVSSSSLNLLGTIYGAYFDSLANNMNLVKEIVKNIPYIEASYNISINQTYETITYSTVKEYLTSIGNSIISADDYKKILLLATDSKEDYYKVIDYLLNLNYGYYSYIDDISSTIFEWISKNYVEESGNVYKIIDDFDSSLSQSSYDVGQILSNVDESNITSYVSSVLEMLNEVIYAKDSNSIFGNSFVIKLDNQTYNSTIYQAVLSTSSSTTINIDLPANALANVTLIASGSGNVEISGEGKTLSQDISTITFENIENNTSSAKQVVVNIPSNTNLYSINVEYTTSSNSTPSVLIDYDANDSYLYYLNQMNLRYEDILAGFTSYTSNLMEQYLLNLNYNQALGSLKDYEYSSTTNECNKTLSLSNYKTLRETAETGTFNTEEGFTFVANNSKYLVGETSYISTGGKAQSTNNISFTIPSGATNVALYISFSSNNLTEKNMWIDEKISSTNYESAAYGYATSASTSAVEYTVSNISSGTYYINFSASIRIYSIVLEYTETVVNSSGDLFTIINDSLLSFNVTAMGGTIYFTNTTTTESYPVNIDRVGNYLVNLPSGAYKITLSKGFNTNLTGINYFSNVEAYTSIGVSDAYQNILSNYSSYDEYKGYLDKYKIFSKASTPTICQNTSKEIVSLFYAVHQDDNNNHPDYMLYTYLTEQMIKNIILQICNSSNTSLESLIDKYGSDESLRNVITQMCDFNPDFLSIAMQIIDLNKDTIAEELLYKIASAYIGTDFAINIKASTLTNSLLYSVLSIFPDDYQFILSNNDIDNDKFIALMQHLEFELSIAGYGIYAMSSSLGILNGQFVPDNIDLASFDPYYKINSNNQFILTEQNDSTWRGGTITVDGIIMPNTKEGSVNEDFYVIMKQLKKSIATNIFKLELISTDGSEVILNPIIDNSNNQIDFYIPKNGDGVDLTYIVNTVDNYELSYGASFFNDGESHDKYNSRTLSVSSSSINSSVEIMVYAEDRTVYRHYTVSLHLTDEISFELVSAIVNNNQEVSFIKSTSANTVIWDATSSVDNYMVSAIGGVLSLEFNVSNLAPKFNLAPYITIDNETIYHTFNYLPLVSNENEFIDGSYGNGSVVIDMAISSNLPKGNHTLQIMLGTNIIYQVKFSKLSATQAQILSMTMIDYKDEVVDVTFKNKEATTYVKYGIGYDMATLKTITNNIPNYLVSYSTSANAKTEIEATYELNGSNFMVYKILYKITPESGSSVIYTHYLIERDPYLDAKENDSYVSSKVLNYVNIIKDGQTQESSFDYTLSSSGSITMSYEREDNDGNQLTPNYRFNYEFGGFFGTDITEYITILEGVDQNVDNNLDEVYLLSEKYYGFNILFNDNALPIDYLFNLVYTRTINWSEDEEYLREYIFPTITISKLKSEYAYLDKIRFVAELANISDTSTDTSLEEITIANYQKGSAVDFTASESILYYNTDTAKNASEYYIVGAVSGEELSSYAPVFSIKSYSRIYQYININMSGEQKKYTYLSAINSSSGLEELLLVDESNQVYSKNLIYDHTIEPIGTFDGNQVTYNDSVIYTVSEYYGLAVDANKSLVMDYIGSPEDGKFWYVDYVVVAEDGIHYKNYHIAVIDMTNNVKFNFEILDSTNTLSLDSLFITVVAYDAYYGKKAGETVSKYYLYDENGIYSPDDASIDDSKKLVTNTVSGWAYKKEDGTYTFDDIYHNVESYGMQALSYSYFYFYIDLPEGYSVKYVIEDSRFDSSIQWSDNSFLPKKTIVTQKVKVTMIIEKSDDADIAWGQKIMPFITQEAILDFESE